MFLFTGPQRIVAKLSRPGIRFRALSPAARISLVVLAVVILAAACAPLVADNPLTTGIPVQPPGSQHWFGTDRIGRDIFARVVYGARYSLVIGLGSTAVAVVVGAVLGSLAATSPKWGDESVMRVLDVVMSFPPIALAAVLVTVFGSSVPVLIFTIAAVYVPSLARVVRANVMAQYGEDYVAAEKVIGARRAYIVLRHVAVNCAAPVMVFATVLVAEAIIFEASLSFIGAGVKDPEPSWGNVLSYGRQILLSGGWWATLFPGLVLLVTVLALNILSEGLTDASAAPGAARAESPDPAAAAVLAGGGAALSAAAPATEAPATGAKSLGAAPLTATLTATGPDDSPGADIPGDGSSGDDDRAAVQRDLVQRSLVLLAERMTKNPPMLGSVPSTAAELLSVRDLSIRFPDRYGEVPVVDGISLTVREGETLGLVGESGCGKSITSLAVMGLLARNAEVSGAIDYRGEDLLGMTPRRRRVLAGPEIAMVYQDAMSSLNPSVLIGRQLKQLTSRGGTQSPAELLDLVGLSPDRTLRSYPHELSGGQRQRVLIAMALSRSPRLLIADEPTTALDVTVQAQIVELLIRLRDELGFAMILVSHDLALVSGLAHRVAVMYAGQVAETGDTRALLSDPAHHYTRGLLGSVTSLEAGADRLHQISGVVPAPRQFGAGCRFASRCEAATEVCRTRAPELTGRPGAVTGGPGRPGAVTGGPVGAHSFACHHAAEPVLLQRSGR